MKCKKGKINFKKLFLITFSIFLPSIIFSQVGSISGIISDLNGNTQPGVTIAIERTSNGIVTDKNGFYKINNIHTGTYTMRVSLMGYETKEQKIVIAEGNNQYNLGITESNVDLNEVVITGTKTEKSIKDVPVITQVIKAEKMIEMGVTNITDALQKSVPGLDVSQFGTRTAITMQGLNANYVLFLIDGERLAGEINGDIDYSRLNLDNIDRIEIIKGASSSLYGSNAIGGVINIITKKTTEPFEAKIYSRYSKFNELFSGAGIALKNGIFASRTNFNYNRTDGYDLTPESQHDWTQNPFSSYNINQKFEITPGTHLSFVMNVGYYQFERGNVSARPAHDFYRDLNGGLNGKYYFGKHSIDFSYYRDRYSTYDVLELLNNRQDMVSYDIIQTARTQANFHLSDKNTIITGLEYNYEDLFSTRIDGNTKNADETVLYAQEDIRFGERLDLVAGIRASNHSNYGMHAAPKISIMYKLGVFNFRTSAGLGFRSPTLKELYMNFDHFGEWRIIGNPLLKPESSKFISGSVEFLKPWNNSSVTLYRNDLKNMINGDHWLPDTGQELVRQYQNIASAYVYGVDFISKQKISKSFWFSTGYSCVYSYDNQTKLQLYGSTRHSGNFAFDYNFRKNDYSFTAQVYCKLMGEKFYDTVTSIDKPYANWRITVSQEYKWIRLTTGLDNVFNIILKNNLDFISPGRRIFIGLNFDLGKLR
jgi:outer membrane receptor for ferrienterochelin and colicins